MAVDYFSKVQQAIEFVESHIAEDVTMDNVAQHVGFSAFHFHRIFHSMTGETMTEYIRKRRLTIAARDLFYTDKRVIEIALQYGFASQEAFTRAFKKVYAVTPGHFRKNKRHLRTLYALTEKKLLDERMIKHMQRGITMEPKIVKKDSFTVMGLQCHSSEAVQIPALWDLLDARTEEIKNAKHPGIFLGVMEPTGKNIEFNYIAGVEVKPNESVPQGMVRQSFPANQYAVFTHKGSTAKLRDTYQYIYGTWYPKSGCERAEGPEIELYDDERFFGPHHDESEIDIYIPIK